MSWDTSQLEKTIMNLSTLGRLCSLTLLIAILMPASPASAQLNPVDLGVKIGEKIGGKIVNGGKSAVRGAAKILNLAGRHGKVTPIYIDGKRAFLIDIYDAEGSRCTLDFDLKTRFKGRLWLVAAAVASGRLEGRHDGRPELLRRACGGLESRLGGQVSQCEHPASRGWPDA